MKKFLGLILTFGMILLLAGCGQKAQPVSLTVAAAASLTDVTKKLAEDYKTVAPNVTLNFTYASSGALQTQIEQGAVVDVFLSAAQKQMDALAQKDLLQKDSRVDLLENKVVLIVPKNSTLQLAGFADLATEKVKKIAIGDPASVPAGQYAKEVFTSLKIWDSVEEKANLGSDVRQVLTWVESGEVDCGVVYSTDAAISAKITVICEAPADSVQKIIYPAAVIKSSKHTAEAGAFLKYLKTAKAAAIFNEYGFTTIK